MKRNWILLVLFSLLYCSCNFDDVEDERETWKVYEGLNREASYSIKRENDSLWKVYEGLNREASYSIKRENDSFWKVYEGLNREASYSIKKQ